MNIVSALTANGVGVSGADDNQAQQGHIIAGSLQAKDGRGVHSDMETFVASPITSSYAKHGGASACKDSYPHNVIAHTLRSEGFDASEDGSGRGTPIVPVAIQEGMDRPEPSSGPQGKGYSEEGVAFTLESRERPQAVAFAQNTRDEVRLQNGDGSISGALGADVGMKQQTYLQQGMAVRWLTPRECERLQGFPDDWTRYDSDGKELSDSARYRMLGNAVTVNVARWIGNRFP